jgi:arylsulfatase A-like enzyme
VTPSPSDEVTSVSPPAISPPNIILLLADDLGWGDVGAYNEASVIPTPNIDRLARQGMQFTDAHAPSSVCTPTRYAIMTGRYAWRTRLDERVLKYFDPPLIEPGRYTLPEMLRDRGFVTGIIGKWHLGLNVPTRGGDGFARMSGEALPVDPDFGAPIQGTPLDYGFDTWFGAQLRRVKAFVRDRHFVGEPRLSLDGREFRVPGWDESQKGPIQLAKALEFIERSHAQNPNRPFFLYYASQAPHAPYKPASSIAGIRVANTSGVGPRGDLVVELDAILGQIMSRLDTLGIAKDTLIFFSSDNGPNLTGENTRHDAAGDWRGKKGSNFEAGHRVPLVARWGNGTSAASTIPPGALSGDLIGLQDLMATLAQLTGASLAPNTAEDSASFLPAMLGRPSDEAARRHLVHHSAAGEFAIRKGRWKLLFDSSLDARNPESVSAAGGQLFDLSADPSETNDRYANHPEVVATLKALMERELRTGH